MNSNNDNSCKKEKDNYIKLKVQNPMTVNRYFPFLLAEMELIQT
jgi:hypothetical protein